MLARSDTFQEEHDVLKQKSYRSNSGYRRLDALSDECVGSAGRIETEMIRNITALIAAATCAGLIVFIAPGLVREIAAVAMPFGELHTGMESGSFINRLPESGCARDPWPYGCDWRAPSERSQIVKKARNRYRQYSLTTSL